MVQLRKIILKISNNFKTFVFALLCMFIVISFIYDVLHFKYIQNLLQGTFNSDKTPFKYCFCLSIFKYQTLEQIAETGMREARQQSGIGVKIRTNSAIGKRFKQFSHKSEGCRRFVTVGDYMGRMGNQMFQVTSLVGTAYKYDVIPVISQESLLNEYFELPNVINPKSNKVFNIVNCNCNKSAVYYNCTEEFKTGKNVSLHGYLQSWKYFHEANDVIKNVFKLKTKHLLNAKGFLTNVSISGHQVICIHIRRGDILTKEKLTNGYVRPGLDFVEKAKQFYINKYSRLQFLVVSNDKAWCRKYLKNVVISPFTEPGDDMALMALSDHVVVTTGTFGWWGAWLSGGTTVYYDKFPRPGSPLATRMSKEDYYPPNWIGMS